MQMDTNLKLDLEDFEGNRLIGESDKFESEMHYLRFECYVDSYDVYPSVFVKVIK